MYELLFWNYQEEIYLNHHLVYEALVEKQNVDGLEELPIQVILNRVANSFSTWEKEDGYSYKNPKNEGGFHIITTPKSIQINCYGVEGKTMNTLCDIMEEYKCPLYDPQIPMRYDEFNE